MNSAIEDVDQDAELSAALSCAYGTLRAGLDLLTTVVDHQSERITDLQAQTEILLDALLRRERTDGVPCA